MDKYPEELLVHEAPLLLVSGLGPPDKHSQLPAYPLLAHGPLVSSELPPLTSQAGNLLLDCFLQHDASGVWVGRNERAPKGSPPVFRIRAVGREYRLPPRKAPPPSSGGPSEDGPPTRNLHSPLSPLSPDSPLYPDGLVSHIWLRKHHSLLPAVFLSFFELYTETNDTPLQNLKDNEVIAAINASKKQFAAASSNPLATTIGSDEFRTTGHRTRFAAVVLSEESIVSPQVEERLSFIKRSTNLVTNSTFFFFPSKVSPVELQHFATSLLLTLNPAALDYYRELSKHARRKRNKGSVPPPTIPTSRALSSQAWTLRYDFKLGVFAEFRQDMEAALRSYETAYEKLFTEVFETTSSWNERWKEERLLADILSLRMVRCYLWMEDYTGAKRRWSYHVAMMREVLDRRGRGTDTYGFAAWMSRWNQCLAELLRLADLHVLGIPALRPPIADGVVDQEPAAIMAPPGRLLAPGDRFNSQDYLHHPGYYYLRAAEWTAERKNRASKISAEDADIHDTYLCPDPQQEAALDHAQLRMGLLVSARREFELRQQKRMADSIASQLAVIKMAAASKDLALWGEALKDLRAIASTYRKEGWWKLLEDVLWRMIECGRKSGDGGSVIIAELELMCRIFRQRKGWEYRLGGSLEGIDTIKVKPTMVVKAGDVVSMLSVSYAFQLRKGHVGDSVVSQLTLTSHAQPSARLVISELKITYDGLKPVFLRHDSALSGELAPIRLSDLKNSIREQINPQGEPPPSPGSVKSTMGGYADLSIGPGETRVYEISTVLREAGDAKAVVAELTMASDAFDLDLICMLDDDESSLGSVHPLPFKKRTTHNGGNGVWWYEAGGELKKKPVRALHPFALQILPRPPKMEIITHGLEAIYTDEVVTIGLEILNGEDEEAIAGAEIRILGWPEENVPAIKWKSDEDTDATAAFHALGSIKPSDRAIHQLSFQSPSIPADCAVEVKLKYHLLSDPDTPVEKTVVADMPIITPFHATYDFSPRVHQQRWPDYFAAPDGPENAAQGIIQRWCLTATILGVAEQSLIVEGLGLQILQVDGGVECTVSEGDDSHTQVLEPTTSLKFPLLLDIQKHSLEDRSPSSVDANLVISWRRGAETPVVQTTLSVPHLFVPLREPRLLALAKPSETQPVMDLSYTIENPTTYFLTFNILMDPNDKFAFSGPKQTSLQLLPMSRVSLDYRLFPHVRGAFIRPKLRVVDRYFNKELRTAGGDGMSSDKDGLMIWVPENLP